MKNIIFISFIIIFLFTSCNKENEVESPLTDQEKSDLIYLRQEEKLAYDVYNYAYKKYEHFAFFNISSSEKKHIDQVATLLDKYNVPDPASELEQGVFIDEDLQVLYHQLIAKVNISQVDALEIGATIEDRDIWDIRKFYANTSKDDITQMYDLLKCGSRNHLRGFTSQLKLAGKTYVPTFLSVDDFQGIINGSHESCGQ